MGNKNVVYLTQDGLDELKKELDNLINVRRPENVQAIKEARSLGDLSENAEYDAAKEEQGHIEKRIEEIEKILKNAEVVDEDEIDLEKINIGCKVKLYDFEYDEELEFYLVGSTEADSLNNKISNESPLGKAMIGARIGEVIEVEMPTGNAEYKILDIQRNVEA